MMDSLKNIYTALCLLTAAVKAPGVGRLTVVLSRLFQSITVCMKNEFLYCSVLEC